MTRKRKHGLVFNFFRCSYNSSQEHAKYRLSINNKKTWLSKFQFHCHILHINWPSWFRAYVHCMWLRSYCCVAEEKKFCFVREDYSGRLSFRFNLNIDVCAENVWASFMCWNFDWGQNPLSRVSWSWRKLLDDNSASLSPAPRKWKLLKSLSMDLDFRIKKNSFWSTSRTMQHMSKTERKPEQASLSFYHIFSWTGMPEIKKDHSLTCWKTSRKKTSLYQLTLSLHFLPKS